MVRDLMLPKVGRYSEATLVICVTILQCKVWQPDSSLTLWIREGTSIENRLTRSVGGQSGLVTL